MVKFMLPCLLQLALAANSAWAADMATELRRCKGVAEAAARLACFDAIALEEKHSPNRSADAPEPSLPARPAAAASAVPAGDFGRESPIPVAVISTHFEGRFEGWEPGSRIRLGNGQVWAVADGSRGAYWLLNPKVNVVRGALGAHYLEVPGTSISVRVRRLE